MMTSAAETPSSLWMSTGMPRPLSETVQDPSALRVTVTRSAWPARASSMALSTTSYTMWCSPEPSSVSPIYMPGRLRTASRPFNTRIDSAPYSACSVWGVSDMYFLGQAGLEATERLAPSGAHACALVWSA